MNLTTLAALVLLTGFGGSPDQPPKRDLPFGLEKAPWEFLEVDDCEEKLKEAGYTEYQLLQHQKAEKLRRRGYDDMYCFVPQGMLLTHGVTGIKWVGYTKVNCSMALALARFEEIAQEEAERIFGQPNPITYIAHLGTFRCRRLRESPDVQSQHSFGNGIDVTSFLIRGYGLVDIKRHWTAKYPAQEPASEFLHALSRRLEDESVFTNVLDPTYDPAHYNHFHLDLAPDTSIGTGFFRMTPLNLDIFSEAIEAVENRLRGAGEAQLGASVPAIP